MLMNIDLDKFDCVICPQKSQYPYGVTHDSYITKFQKVTGLNFSSGLCILSKNKKAVFVDGRYTLSAKRILDQREFDIYPYSNTQIEEWVKNNIQSQGKIVFDWNEYTLFEVKCWHFDNYELIGMDFPQESNYEKQSRVFLLPLSICGETYAQKFNAISHVFKYGEALLINDPLSISWLFNIRGCDDSHSLALLSRAIVKRDGSAVIYTENTCIFNDVLSQISVKKMSELERDIQMINVLITDEKEVPYRISRLYNNIIYKDNPCIKLKTKKNDVELDNLRKIHVYDGVAMTKFLYWLYHTDTHVTEISAADQLRRIRSQCQYYLSDSFEYISAANEHSAEIHYHSSKNSDQVVDGFYLIDSGGQYLGGTTDITRTVCLSCPTHEQKEMYTRVLMGHIDLFLSEVTDNRHLDQIARKYLLDIGQDYPHSTGHGVGYMSHVHEGPIHISSRKCEIKFQPGMILSNEPGYYKADHYGIRIENMMEVVQKGNGLYFKTLTLVPYSKELIIVDMLSSDQLNWLQDYNNILLNTLSPFLNTEECLWLKESIDL